MKRILLTLSFLSFLFYSNAQKIINLVYVGDKGVTDNIRETKYFIVVKQFPGGFQRLDYKMHGPLMNVKTYSDSAMKMLNGIFYSYRENGRLQISGSYNNNKKNNDWYYYNDTFKVIKKERYADGVLLETTDPDTARKEIKYDDQRQGGFDGGQKAWVKFLIKTINPDVVTRSVNGGVVYVRFLINKNGDVEDIHLRKSVEFILDEEALRVLYKSPKWIPAFQNGHTVNAYRVQPFTFDPAEE